MVVRARIITNTLEEKVIVTNKQQNCKVTCGSGSSDCLRRSYGRKSDCLVLRLKLILFQADRGSCRIPLLLSDCIKTVVFVFYRVVVLSQRMNFVVFVLRLVIKLEEDVAIFRVFITIILALVCSTKGFWWSYLAGANIIG